MNRLTRLKYLVNTFFFLGAVPRIPGTVGSLGGVVLWAVFQPYGIAYLTVFSGIFLLSLWSIPAAIAQSQSSDPQYVVVDEVIGILVAGAFIVPTWKSSLALFFLFRAFDITKPPPCRRLEKTAGALGVILDDVMAGIYAGIALIFLQGFVL